MSLTVQQGLHCIKSRLIDRYPANEIQSFQRILLSHLLQCAPVEIHLNYSKLLADSQEKSLIEMIEALNNNKPIQYILGKTTFYGLDFCVNPAVLIPRPETEELVDLIVKENKNKTLQILDIGTGSGCIAISISKFLPESKVMAMDISEEALKTARMNAEMNNTKVDFIQNDILNPEMSTFPEFDIIVSNPPYVTNQEKELMNANVLNYEPHLALFVADNDPLKFYNSIIYFANKKLKKGGRIYFEINEMFGNQISIALRNNNFCNIVLINDINGKQRMISGEFCL